MNRVFLIIKGWIILQMTRFKDWCISLFTKEVPNTKDEFIATDDSTQTDSFLPEDEFEKNKLLQVNEELDTNTVWMEDSESIFTDNFEENSKLQPQDIPLQQPEFLLYNGKYDALFSTIEIPVPMSAVHEEIWDILHAKMPSHYTIPAPTSKNLYTPNLKIIKGA